ncbi:hypothetical protein SCHPADRAFT_275654 [Schizopora paradoxa]|uniref:Ubiquitin 3 binding protein But2 C-terminal domain-containing protein n=1 Tax=Schizopora paradoxa TaxID=27342 RepID=A0A0H2RU94_9AGAM|nr:hypothetical protein SCHPADRAFT_275654 [Schizopora paradoxa]
MFEAFWPKKKSVPYIALAENGSGNSRESEELLLAEQDSKDDGFLVEPAEEKREKGKFSVALIVCTVVLSMANLWFFIHQFGARVSLKPAASSHPDSDLELANAYIGFDKLHSNDSYSSTFNYSIENMPLELGSVDREHPDTVRPDETPQWWTASGLVIPDRRHIFVNETVSTIVQFRAQDYGLETCQPTVVLPTYASLVDSTVKSDHDKPRTYNLSAPSVPIHVWALQSTTRTGHELEIDFSQLTFANRPQRKTYLGVIEAQEGVRASADAFQCRSGSLHMLELSCEKAGCLLDLWTDQDKPRMAFFIKQTPSW